MSILLGDATRTNLAASALDTIDTSVSCAVDLLEYAERMRVLNTAIAGRTAVAERRFADLQELGRELSNALLRKVKRTDSDMTALGDRIRQGASEEVAREVRRVRSALSHDCDSAREQLAEMDLEWRERLRQFLLHTDLPGSRGKLSIIATDEGAYTARLRVRNDAGLGATFQLSVASDSMLASPLRVCDLVKRLKVRVPHKGRVLKRHGVAKRKLGAYLVTGVVHTGNGTLICLRKKSDDELGFDLRFAFDDDSVSITAVGHASEEVMPAHRADGDDADNLRELEQALLELIVPLSGSRSVVGKIKLAGVSLGDIQSPVKIAKQLVHSIALMVQEVAAHSASATALVLRDGDHVLELERSQLLKAIHRLPQGAQAVFYPLGLTRPSTVPPTPPPEAFRRRSLTEVDRGWDRPSTH